ncbi:MAG: metallophosphoesterase [Muribaculaceae bacterium]|nr:metallophosphoesterase [Muribaculaceae bacterium]
MTIHSQSKQEPLRIAHLADPQLGFGPGGFDDDLEAFKTEIRNVNSLRPDLVVIAGDMVNKMDSSSVARFKEAASAIEAPVVYTPGNHDISEPCTPRGLKKYREAFGPDFSVHSLAGGRTLISFNSLLLRGGPDDEMDKAATTLREALSKAHCEGSAVILLCHVPPFAKDVDEDDAYYNLPKAIRRPLLECAADAGTFLWLCGHTHKTHRNDYEGIAILNPENTSCNFDRRPRGFRMLTIADDNSFSWEFVPNENCHEHIIR